MNKFKLVLVGAVTLLLALVLATTLMPWLATMPAPVVRPNSPPAVDNEAEDREWMKQHELDLARTELEIQRLKAQKEKP
jgi:hypothetical protein